MEQSETIITGSIEKSGSFIPYAKFGNGEKTLVLLPGLYTKSLIPFAEAVKNQYGRFLNEYTIYFVDRLASPPEGYSFENLADDTVSVLKELGIEKCEMIGISAGGFLAQLIALKAPKLAEKIFLGSTSCCSNGNSRALFAEWTELAEKNRLQELGECFSENVYSPAFYEKFKDAILLSLSDTTEEDLKHFAVYTKAAIDFDISNRICNIKCPVLCAGASDDRIFGKEGSLLIERYMNLGKNNCSSFIYENEGHAVYDENPDYLNLVEKFFSE